MTKFICMECFKTFEDKFIKWYKKNPHVRDTQVCAKCYGKHLKYDLLKKDYTDEERKKLDLDLLEVMGLLNNEN